METTPENISAIMFPETAKFNRKFSGYLLQPCCRMKVPQRLELDSGFEASNWLADRFKMSEVTLDPQIFLKSCPDDEPSLHCLIDDHSLHVVPSFEVISPVFALNEPTVTHSFLLLLNQVARDDCSRVFLGEFMEIGKIFCRQFIAYKNNTVNFGLNFAPVCEDLEPFTLALKKKRSAQSKQLIELYLLVLCLAGLVVFPDEETMPFEVYEVGSEIRRLEKFLNKKHRLASATDSSYLKFVNYNFTTAVK